MISEGASRLSKHISNKIQIGKLTSNAHNNKKIVNNLGIEFSFNKMVEVFLHLLKLLSLLIGHRRW